MSTQTGIGELLAPLELFYTQEKRALPAHERIEGAAMPEPYRSLLVHHGDMTPALETYHKQRVRLDVLKTVHSDPWYARMVVLRRESDGVAVEFGAIRINLSAFPEMVQELILEGKRPLGGVLLEHGVRHLSKPEAYFNISADDIISSALKSPKGAKLFGRRNAFWNSGSEAITEIVEVLPELKSQGA